MTEQYRVDRRGIEPIYALLAMALVAIVLTVVIGVFLFGLV
jgi:FlaG/FlaF family flagellin (archaellin)